MKGADWLTIFLLGTIRLRTIPELISQCLERGTFMYAVIANGGKQYQVTEGDEIRLEKCTVDVGSTMELSDVLLIPKEGSSSGCALCAGQKLLLRLLVMAEQKSQYYQVQMTRYHMNKWGIANILPAKVVSIVAAAK